MNVRERDVLAMAPPEVVRAAGLDLPDGYDDAVHPSDEWRGDMADLLAKDRQLAALQALGKLTRDDVRIILEALQ